MRIPTKKWFKKTFSSIGVMVITYIILDIIIKGSFANIDWEDLLVTCLVFLITYIVMIGKEDLK